MDYIKYCKYLKKHYSNKAIIFGSTPLYIYRGYKIMFCFNYSTSALPFNNFYQSFPALNMPNFTLPVRNFTSATPDFSLPVRNFTPAISDYTFQMPNFLSFLNTPNLNFQPYTNPVSIWNNPFTNNFDSTNSLINPVRRNNYNTTPSLFPQLSLSNTTPSAAVTTTNYNSNHGQRMLDYAKQYAGKTQNEMRGIMKGEGYAFHTNLWCADFVSFITGKALGEENLPEWYKKCNRAYVPDIEKQARKNGAIVAERHGGTLDTTNVRPGHYAIFNWEKDNSRVDHIGYVIKVEGNKVYTIEGNAGGKVSYNTRDLSLIHSFVDIG